MSDPRDADGSLAARVGRTGPRYQPLDWAQIRAPLLPVEAYLGLAHGADPWAADARVRAALAVGSLHLSEALERPGAETRGASQPAGKLLRYLIRMSTRPTPFGLFAGVGLIGWADATDVRLDGARPPTRTRPDMAWLLGMVQELEALPAVCRRLSYIANTAAFSHGDRIFLSQPPPDVDSLQRRPPVSVRATALAREALRLARRGVSHAALVRDLIKCAPATPERMEGLIDTLRRQGFLLTDLRPPLTVANPAEYVAQRLRNIPEAGEFAERLEHALAAMTAWDEAPLDDAAASYRRLPGTTREAGRPASARAAPQVDMALPLAARRVAGKVAEEAARAAELMLHLSPFPKGAAYLAAYRERFERKYGRDREAPLLELLHPDAGLGSPFAETEQISARASARSTQARDLALLNLAATAIHDRRLAVDLDEATISRIELAEDIEAPASIEVSAFVLAGSAAAIDAGDFKLMVGPNAGGVGAGKSLGRFVDLLGEPARAALADVARREASRRPWAIQAESVYQPSSFHAANIAVRGHARSHEMTFGAASDLDLDRVIPLDELTVGIRAGRFYLRWPVEDREVTACVSHMLNNSEAPELVRFVEDLQQDGRAQFTAFDWGAASALPALPRLQKGRIVLCPARWRIDAQARDEFDADEPSAFASRLAAWRERWLTPRFVYLCFHDNRLMIDLENAAQVDELRLEIRAIKGGESLLIEEALPAPEHAWLPGSGGRFVVELIVPLVNRNGEKAPALVRAGAKRAHDRADRMRPPGSDWLFANIYCSPAFEERLVIDLADEIIDDAVESGLAKDWFFIRYADPDAHLRVRCSGDPARLLAELMPRICVWTSERMRSGVCSRFGFDTYDRELERYGGVDGMEAAEALFAADSRSVARMLDLAASGGLGIDRTALAVLSVDDLLCALGWAPGAPPAWRRNRAAAGRPESEEFRERKAELRDLLGGRDRLWRRPGGPALAGVLEARRGEVVKIAQRLEALDRQSLLSQDRADLARSYVHMHCNRLLARDGPSEERVLALVERTRESLAHAPLP